MRDVAADVNALERASVGAPFSAAPPASAAAVSAVGLANAAPVTEQGTGQSKRQYRAHSSVPTQMPCAVSPVTEQIASSSVIHPPRVHPLQGRSQAAARSQGHIQRADQSNGGQVAAQIAAVAVDAAAIVSPVCEGSGGDSTSSIRQAAQILARAAWRATQRKAAGDTSHTTTQTTETAATASELSSI